MKKSYLFTTFMFSLISTANAGILLDASCRVECSAIGGQDFNTVGMNVDSKVIYVDYTDGLTKKELDRKFENHSKLCEKIQTDFSRKYDVSYGQAQTSCDYFKH